MEDMIMKASNWADKITFFVMGACVVLALFFLTGATNFPLIGRYQLEILERRGFADIYVIDTTNGIVKWYDQKDEGKPFEQITKK
jgi:hypothetical protein